MNKITAIIPVRAGSTRLKNKNVAPFAGTNLLVNEIRQLQQVDDMDESVSQIAPCIINGGGNYYKKELRSERRAA